MEAALNKLHVIEAASSKTVRDMGLMRALALMRNSPQPDPGLIMFRFQNFDATRHL